MADFAEVLFQKAPATELGTRDILAKIMAQLSSDLPAEKAGMIEVALAEIINNIVEHAYADQDHGEIAVNVTSADQLLVFEISDDGVPFPGGELPQGASPELGTSRETLPEGGFGWLLIRSLAKEIHYSRSEGMNRLCVAFDLGEHAMP